MTAATTLIVFIMISHFSIFENDSNHNNGRNMLPAVILRGRMNITVLAVGKLKDRFFEEGCAEYGKRLARYCALTVREAADEKAPENLFPAQEEQVKEREGKRLLAMLDQKDHVIALTGTGRAYTSEGLAARIGQLRDQGRNVSFLIGGSLGLSGEAVARADEELSLSKLTLPHRLARLVLLEQLYRSFKILNHETYHK